MIFQAYGHPNIRATHKNTFEITKDKELTKEGDCIIGVNANFNVEELKRFAKENKKAIITLKARNKVEQILTEINPLFDDEKEIVIRLGEHASNRTFGVRANKAAKHLSQELVKELQKGATLEVKIEKTVE